MLTTYLILQPVCFIDFTVACINCLVDVNVLLELLLSQKIYIKSLMVIQQHSDHRISNYIPASWNYCGKVIVGLREHRKIAFANILNLFILIWSLFHTVHQKADVIFVPGCLIKSCYV